MKFSHWFLIMLGLLSSDAQIDPFADDDSYPILPAQQVSLYLEMIEIDALEYASWMSKKHSAEEVAVFRQQLLKRVKAGKAKLIENQLLVVGPSKETETESILEYIYETEYEPPGSEGFYNTPGLTDLLEEMPSSFELRPSVPTAFETKNVGLTVRFGGFVNSESGAIEMSSRIEYVKHVDDYVAQRWNSFYVSSNRRFPLFYTLRTANEISLNDGEFSIISSHTPSLNGKADPAKKVILFAKASILIVNPTTTELKK